VVVDVSQRVSVLGAGNMAGAMVGTLRRAGFDVTVWNRTAERAEAVATTHGAATAASAADAVTVADVVLSSLADDEAVLATYLRDGGVAAATRPGQVVLEMSTVAPETSRRVGDAVAETGASFLDAPVSGSVPTAEKGELTIIVGGEATALEQARSVLGALAAKIFHVGALGSGAIVKLAVNALVHAIDVGLSEALVLAEKSGVNRTAAYDVFAAGAAAAPFVLYKRPAFEDPANAPLTFTLDLMAKDLDLILALATTVEAPMDQAERNREIVERALASGFAGRDMSAVAEYLRGSS
jgi:3-hydroxyisobutyrate dehydrogenase-like beta-hydroxyacid dehydrogenase